MLGMRELQRLLVLTRCFFKFGYYSLWLVLNKARMDIVLPACYTFQITRLIYTPAISEDPRRKSIPQEILMLDYLISRVTIYFTYKSTLSLNSGRLMRN